MRKLALQAEEATQDSSLEILARRYCYGTGRLPFRYVEDLNGDRLESSSSLDWQADVMKVLAAALECKEEWGKVFWQASLNELHVYPLTLHSLIAFPECLTIQTFCIQIG